MPSKRDSYATRPTVSGISSILLSAFADWLALVNSLQSRGALGRALQIPATRAASRGLRWWSRGWVGQVLGFGWCAAVFVAGLRNEIEPSQVGDDWERYRAGVIPRPHK